MLTTTVLQQIVHRSESRTNEYRVTHEGMPVYHILTFECLVINWPLKEINVFPFSALGFLLCLVRYRPCCSLKALFTHETAVTLSLRRSVAVPLNTQNSAGIKMIV
ncbi:hypothetical protein AVEN_232415-1 [Araneus ventricosus]|uniref:Uncharacterized protein n=1 Tax=Araneus ventricosus TaxID=182803 RepID=A0A4Y2P3P1_ARAVE|nr:hypothetical protein AVEN_232415-1 [Araneus ventricosus]